MAIMAASTEFGRVAAVAAWPHAAPGREGVARHRRLPLVVALAVVGAVTFHFFPLFHFVPLTPPAEAEPNRAGAALAIFDAAAAAEKIWTGTLLPAARAAAPLAPVLAAMQHDAAAAAQRHAHRVGLGRSAYYFGRGTGRVVAVEGSRMAIAVDGAEAEVELRHGPLFGNAVRDGTGLLNVNAFPGLQEYNALAAELNRLVEARVFPALRELAQPGQRLVFAGVAEAPESAAAGPALTVVPLHVERAP